MRISRLEEPARCGLLVVARDAGPGIPDVDLALSDGHSTYGGLGLGLPGCRRLMDEFVLESEAGKGTTVTMRKWRSTGGPADDEEQHRWRARRDARARARCWGRRPTRTAAGWLDDKQLLPELVAHLREHRSAAAPGVGRAASPTPRLLPAMTPQEIHSETTSVYDNYVEVLETGSVEALRHYARDLSERIIPRGVETNEVVGIVLLLRDVLARSLFQKYSERPHACSTTCSTPTSRRRTASPTRWP